MKDVDIEVLKLPWEIQVALASGYAAYVLAYTGLRDRQRTIDVAFISLVFSLIATLVLWLLVSTGPVISSAAAFVVSLTSGIIWRKIGRPFVFFSLRKANVTWSNDDPSALASIVGNTKCPISQIAVLLDDGTWLSCKDAARFADAPFGPCHIGPNGDVALYLTHEQSPGVEERELTTVRDPFWGDRITYLPASRIKQMTIRHLSKASRSSRAALAADHSDSLVAEPVESSAE
jgi:hypothetical protein